MTYRGFSPEAPLNQFRIKKNGGWESPPIAWDHHGSAGQCLPPYSLTEVSVPVFWDAVAIPFAIGIEFHVGQLEDPDASPSLFGGMIAHIRDWLDDALDICWDDSESARSTISWGPIVRDELTPGLKD